MSAPVRTGGALARQRVLGVTFLVVVSLLIWLTVALYNKDFTKVVKVSLRTDRIGNQLTTGADVKLRGIVVGSVKRVQSNGADAVVELDLKPHEASQIPADVTAQLLPKTLFGEKEVDLQIPSSSSGPTLKDRDIITQDHSSTAVETETAVNDLLPLLKALNPQDLSRTLNALSTALRGRGDELGANLARTAAYLHALNPSLPTLQRDFAGLADFTNTTADATPNLLAVLDNLSFSSRSLVDQKAQLDAFLTSTQGFASSAQSIVAQNDAELVTLARDSIPSLQLYAKYAAEFPCMSATLAALEKPIENSFGGLQSGLHITFEAVADNGTYTPAMAPAYGDTGGTLCYGLDPQHPIIPATDYYNPYDGYYDGQEVDPYTAKPPCTHSPCAEPPKGGRGSSTSALDAVIGAKMGLLPQNVPAVARLLLMPVAQGHALDLR